MYSSTVLEYLLINYFNFFVNDIKLNKTSNCTWVNTVANANVTSGQQGARHPQTPSNSTPTDAPIETSTSTTTSNVPAYLTKTAQ